jgi:CubicO group peptidase (beta-lactamase class C family)
VTVLELSRTSPVVPGIHQALRLGVDDGVFPGGAAAVFLDGALVHLSSTGDAQSVPARVAMRDDARFDLASLTKVLATTAAIAVLAARRTLDLDDRVTRFWTEFGRAGKSEVTIRQLLAHASGLPAWRPFFRNVQADPDGAALFAQGALDRESAQRAARRGTALVLADIARTPLEGESGAQSVYSDLGFIALGRVVERAALEPLDLFVSREIFGALRLPTLGFLRLGSPASGSVLFPTTGVVRPREPARGQEPFVPAPAPDAPPRPRPGEVDDDNAFAMGGVAGHAGLFGCARDVAAFGGAVLEELDGALRLAPGAVWENLAVPYVPAGGARALGFDLPSPLGPAAGRYLAASRTLGHNGFTGTSLWIDRDRSLAVALLTNRVHPRRGNERIRTFRPAFHDAVVEALGLEEL